MKYTVKTFIQNLVGSEKVFKTLCVQEDTKDIYIKFHDDSLFIYDDKDYELENIPFRKELPGVFSFDLYSNNWYFTLEFSDGGLKKNKLYKVSYYIR